MKYLVIKVFLPEKGNLKQIFFSKEAEKIVILELFQI